VSRRQNFSVTIPGVKTTISNQDLTGLKPIESVSQAKFATEFTDGVRRRRPPGWVEPTPYHFERTVWSLLQGTSRVKRFDPAYDYVVTGYMGNETQNYFNDAWLHSTDYTTHRDRALVKARLALKDTDVNLGVAFAERNKTARMVGDNAIAIAKAYRRLRRGDFRGAARELGINKPGKPRGSSATSRWLELQYGWKPLLSDVFGATEALAKRPRSDWRVTSKGSSVEQIDSLITSGLNHTRCMTQATGKRGSFVRIDAVPENDLLIALSSLGITNPLLIGWELVPFSFVVDWILPVGSFLESLDAMLGYGPTWCSMTNFAKVEWNSTGVPQPRHNGGFWYEAVNDTHQHKRYVYVKRTVSESVPLPTLPRFKDPRSLSHMANGLSLLAQVFSSRR